MNIETMSTKSLLFAAQNLFNRADKQTKRPFVEMCKPLGDGGTTPATQFGLSMTLFEPMYLELKRRNIPIPDDIEEFYTIYKEELNAKG